MEEEFAPQDTAERCLALIRPLAGEKGVSVGCECPGELPLILGDRNKIQQVVFNLLTNAVKFTPEGGTVRIRLNEAEGGFLIAVVDTGIGMDAADIPRVMQPFVQADHGNQRRAGGTGLGLPLSKSLVDLHDGTMDITSTRGVGTTVTVRLPRSRVVSPHPRIRAVE